MTSVNKLIKNKIKEQYDSYKKSVTFRIGLCAENDDKERLATLMIKSEAVDSFYKLYLDELFTNDTEL
jgi:hypothetical protein